ncbi:hypothetical protein AVEN_206005-1 [Araneus ventricosus]|uniref:Uncharacterized protein n=1 Tax=Araneus ventricosus TaxID=182803 RepID=A0A4Y2GV97_ARAVE|nr:hypothetical protein AVEN_206005-1 [Araneus ventricosus]
MVLHSVKSTHSLIDRIKLLLVNKPNISLNWVRAHIDIEGIKLADSITESATMKDYIDFDAKIPKSWIKNQLKFIQKKGGNKDGICHKKRGSFLD